MRSNRNEHPGTFDDSEDPRNRWIRRQLRKRWLRSAFFSSRERFGTRADKSNSRGGSGSSRWTSAEVTIAFQPDKVGGKMRICPTKVEMSALNQVGWLRARRVAAFVC